MDRTKTNIPFVGLHAHSVAGSVFDAIGYPQEHMDFAYDNGSSALALTDHGNMNGLAHQVLHTKKMREQGKEFKPIFGCEAYFLPSLEEWHAEYEHSRNQKAKNKKKDKTSGTTIEDEGASKKAMDNILNRRRHLILLAQNQEGLSNLFKIISQSYKPTNFYRYPRIDYDLLNKYSEGIIAASACLGGVYAGDYWENMADGEEAVLVAMRATTEKMLSIFGDRWYGELQWNNVPEQHRLNKCIIKMHEEYGIKLISTADSHYPGPNSWKDRELYKRLGWLGKGRAEGAELPDNVEEIGYELYPKNGDQMWESYQQYSQEAGEEYDDEIILKSITETHRIAHELIDDFMPSTEVRLPDFVVPPGVSAIAALTKMCIEGLRQRGLTENDVYISRLKKELYVIKDRGFSKYFLTMNAIAKVANELMLTGTGRGSAAGSLVAYVLGITQIDPIKYDLQFERFLRSDATDYPDIDYDVAEPMALKQKLIDEWGENCVVPISNWNTLQLRSLIKDISKFYGVPFTEVNLVTSKMIDEATGLAKKKHGIKAGVYNPNFQEVMEYSESLKKFLSKYPHIKTHVEALCGQVRSCSRHAGGVVIAENLDSYMPLINSGGVTQTPWSEGQNVRHLEPMGFIKYDLLGLATLRTIQGAIYHVLKSQGIDEPSYEQIKEFYDNNLHPDKIDLHDQDVYENIFHGGKWAGIFQFTEDNAQAFCQKVKPTSIIDLAAITSIQRPGPLSAGVDKDYFSAKTNPAQIKYVSEAHKSVTQETHGFLIFQEQIAMLAHTLGEDLSLDEGNILRKVLTKKGTGKAAKVKEALHKKFIDGCIQKGLKKSTGVRLWDTFEYFSGYGFNKSHAVCYSLLSFQCAWLLNYYPAAWVAAFLDKEPEDRKEKAINIAKSLGYTIDQVDINKSGTVWEIAECGKKFIQPLTSLKGLGDKAVEQILNNRPFHTVEDLLFNDDIIYSKLNKKALDVLARSGALSHLVDDRFTGAKHFWSAAIVDRPKTKKRFLQNVEAYREEGEFTSEEEIHNIASLTGTFPVSMVMTDELMKKLDEMMVPPISHYDSDLMVAWLIPRNIALKKTKSGKSYYQIDVIDNTNSSTITIRCWGIDPDKDKVYVNRPYLVRPKYDPQWGFSTNGRLAKTWKILA